MWYFYLQTSKINLSVLFRKWGAFYWMEKSECGSSSQERWQAIIKKNCRPISLLTIAGKIFERLWYDKMFEFSIENNLISKNQSGFRLGDFCISQLLFINHEIYQSFEDSLEVKAVFLDISKVFDKVWHEGLIFKLKQNGISDQILNIITDFLSFRKQQVVLKGQASPWVSIEEGVPQGSKLGPLFFLDLH